MKQGKIYNIDIENIGTQDTSVAWILETDKVHYFEKNNAANNESYISIDYNIDSIMPMSNDSNNSSLQYANVFYPTEEGLTITDYISKIEVNGENYPLTELIDNNSEDGDKITLDQVLDQYAYLGMMLPTSGNIKIYLKFIGGIAIGSEFSTGVSVINQYGPIMPDLEEALWHNLQKFNFDSEETLKQIYCLRHELENDDSCTVYILNKHMPISINNINTNSNVYKVYRDNYLRTELAD